MARQQEKQAKSRASQRRARYREIAQIVREERLLDLFRGVGLEEHLPAEIGDAEPAGVKERDLPTPVRVRHALERLGPVFVKVGQRLATRGDLLTPALLKELAELQDNVPPVSFDEMKARVQAELGAPMEELFTHFEEKPIAAASIGQVYRATLADGTAVAVKVQRPGVTAAMDLDLDILHVVAERLANHVQWARDNDVITVVDDFAADLRRELDYTNEGHSLDRFRTFFADDPSLVFPRVYWDQTTSRVLTMDFVDGVPATALEHRDAGPGVDGAQLVQLGVGAYFRMFFELGFYHADPHAGNLFALPGGRLAFVDFGRVATLSERNGEGAFDMLLAMFDDDSAAVADAVLSMTGIPPQIDLAAFEVDVSTMLAQFRRQQESGEGLGQLMQSLLRLMRDHHLHVPAELRVVLTTLGELDGVAHQLDSDFRMMDAAKPFARKLMPERYGPQHALKQAVRSGRAYSRFLEQFPLHATRALRRIGEGELKVAVRVAEYEPLVDRLTAGVYLLAYALIVGALIIGFAFLVGRPGLTQPEQIGYRVILFVAVVSVIWLFGRLVLNEWRKRQANKQARR
jgi:ubiquinone biosynthesis protein